MIGQFEFRFATSNDTDKLSSFAASCIQAGQSVEPLRFDNLRYYIFSPPNNENTAQSSIWEVVLAMNNDVVEGFATLKLDARGKAILARDLVSQNPECTRQLVQWIERNGPVKWI